MCTARPLTQPRPVQQFLAAGSQDKSVSVWPQGESKPLLVLRRAFKASVSDLAWTPDGLTLLAASLDGTVACICFTPAELGTALSQAKVRLPMRLSITWTLQLHSYGRRPGEQL